MGYDLLVFEAQVHCEVPAMFTSSLDLLLCYKTSLVEFWHHVIFALQMYGMPRYCFSKDSHTSTYWQLVKHALVLAMLSKLIFFKKK